LATEETIGTRQHILDAAEQVIQDLGMKGANLRTLTEGAEARKPAKK
jgi:hypothetical protein